MAHVTRSVTVNAPVERIYEMTRDPRHWAAWYVGLSEPERITGDGGVGTVVLQNYKVADMSFPVTNRVLEDRLGPEGAEWKGRIDGLLAGVQTFRFLRRDGGTEIELDLEYSVPGWVLGRFADTLTVERIIEHSAESTLNNLKALCE